MFEISGPINDCSGLSNNGIPWIVILRIIHHLTLILMGIGADIAMSRYLIQKRNNGSGEVKLAPWKVTSNQDKNYKTNVPINATMIGTVYAAVSISFGVWISILYKDDIGTTYCISVISSTLQLPAVLAFTIKHHRKNSSKTAPVVPRTLQFHEQGHEHEQEHGHGQGHGHEQRQEQGLEQGNEQGQEQGLEQGHEQEEDVPDNTSWVTHAVPREIQFHEEQKERKNTSRVASVVQTMNQTHRKMEDLSAENQIEETVNGIIPFDIKEENTNDQILIGQVCHI